MKVNMKDIECPYCAEWQEINHDAGYGFDEGEIHHQECGKCGKSFAFTTMISFSYEAYKADCLNGSDHAMEKVVHHPANWPDWKRCKVCGHEERGKYSPSVAS